MPAEKLPTHTFLTSHFSLLTASSWPCAAFAYVLIASSALLGSTAPVLAKYQPTTLPAPDESTARLLRGLLLWVGLLFAIFVIASLVLLTWSRRYRRWLFGRSDDRPPPTPSEDVWSMHRLPEEESDDAEPPDDV